MRRKETIMQNMKIGYPAQVKESRFSMVTKRVQKIMKRSDRVATFQVRANGSQVTLSLTDFETLLALIPE